MKHGRFYRETTVFKVENVLFRLSRARLESLSPVFRDMFTVPPPTRNDKKAQAQEGASDANPIILEGYKSVDFERLIALIYPSDDFLPGDPPPTYTKEEWTSILKLSTAWEMEKVRKKAIAAISRMSMSATEKIQIGREYRVARWFSEGIEEISATEDMKKYPIEDLAQTLGWEAAARVLYIWSNIPLKSIPNVIQANVAGFRCRWTACDQRIRDARGLSCNAGHATNYSEAGGPWRNFVRITKADLMIPGSESEGGPTYCREDIKKMFEEELQSLSKGEEDFDS
ncbi:hypothetical protein BKA70DRAFT_1287681 [Coprinopsis sp. MPI-PUGE-AT-0042]|nr:hypothetical protein BKA70DRAFT_1287681 [Coprinopsis sp. MPI-PUGE-AT-0042]